jgi:hypothetical protein
VCNSQSLLGGRILFDGRVFLAAGFLSLRTSRENEGWMVGEAMEESEKEVDSGITEATSLVLREKSALGM